MPGSNGVNGHRVLDAGGAEETREDKPCCKRIMHEGVSRFETTMTWCTKIEGHPGECEGPPPSIIDKRCGR